PAGTSPLSLHDALPISVRGAVSVAVEAQAAGLALICAPANAVEAAAVPGAVALAPRTLAEVVDHLRGRGRLRPVPAPPVAPPARSEEHTSELQSRENLV